MDFIVSNVPTSAHGRLGSSKFERAVLSHPSTKTGGCLSPNDKTKARELGKRPRMREYVNA